MSKYPVSGFESVQGRRWNMEDAHLNYDDLSVLFPWIPKEPKHGFYGIWDGHGGREAAVMAEKLLISNLLKQGEFGKIPVLDSLKNSYIAVETEIMKRAQAESWSDGSTSLTSLVIGKKLYLANLGDSEAVIGRRRAASNEFDVIELSQKHTPLNPIEADRLTQLGCNIVGGRVSGILAVSRGFGDIDFKAPRNNGVDFVSSQPHFVAHDLTDADEFVVMACDGLWDVFSYQEAVDFVASQRWNSKSCVQAAENLVKESLDRKTMDNVTCIVVYITEAKTLLK